VFPKLPRTDCHPGAGYRKMAAPTLPGGSSIRKITPSSVYAAIPASGDGTGCRPPSGMSDLPNHRKRPAGWLMINAAGRRQGPTTNGRARLLRRRRGARAQSYSGRPLPLIKRPYGTHDQRINLIPVRSIGRVAAWRTPDYIRNQRRGSEGGSTAAHRHRPGSISAPWLTKSW